MISGINIVSVWVLDQTAREFYTQKLGFELTDDIKLDNGMRWMTVRPPGNANQEFVLTDPAHSMLDPQTAEQVRALVAKGALSGVMATTDCRGDYEVLTGRGMRSPSRRPSGRTGSRRSCATTSGNWFSFTQQHWANG